MNALRNKVQLIGRLGQDPENPGRLRAEEGYHFNLATNGLQELRQQDR